jgi:hypothetical protein
MALEEGKMDGFLYTGVLKTCHSGYHSKWILLKATNYGILFRCRGFFLLPTKAIPHEIVQKIIHSGSAFPLPKDFSEMADSLEWWRRAVDCDWEQNILGLMYTCCKEQTPMDRKNMFKFSIGMLVDRKMEQHSQSDVPLFLKEDWLEYFDTLN